MNFNVTAPGGKTVVTVPFDGVTNLNSFFRLNATTGKYQEFLYNGETGIQLYGLALISNGMVYSFFSFETTNPLGMAHVRRLG